MRSSTASKLAASFILMAGIAAIVRGADEPSRLDQVLARWEAKASTWKTLDVRFTREDRSPKWGASERYDGTLLMKDAETAAIDFKKRGEPTLHERIVFTGLESRWFHAETRQISIFPRSQGDPVKLPDAICLPFLFGRKAAEVQEHYDVRLQDGGTNPMSSDSTPRTRHLPSNRRRATSRRSSMRGSSGRSSSDSRRPTSNSTRRRWSLGPTSSSTSAGTRRTTGSRRSASTSRSATTSSRFAPSRAGRSS